VLERFRAVQILGGWEPGGLWGAEKALFCDVHHIANAAFRLEITSSHRMERSTLRDISMRKFGFFAITTLILAAGFGGWVASTTQARVVTASVSGSRINPLQMMSTIRDMPTDHYVDYSLVYEK
jgi:phosphoribosylcarboxyaminoimidazole (NCAIR) mutase